MKKGNKKKMTYKDGKENARAKAQALQVHELAQSWEEVAKEGAELERLAKRYGLIKEFKNNGII